MSSINSNENFDNKKDINLIKQKRGGGTGEGESPSPEGFPDEIEQPQWPSNNRKQFNFLEKKVKLNDKIFVHGGKQNIPGLILHPAEDLEFKLQWLANYVTDFMNGIIGIKIGDNKHSIKHCSFKMGCDKGWLGTHNYSHPTALWIIWDILKQIYTVESRSTQVKIQNDEELSMWKSTDDDFGNNMYYQHHPDTLPFNIEIEKINPKGNKKLIEIFQFAIPEFFAAQRSMPRIGSLTSNKFCHGPICYFSLFSDSCQNIHSDDVSFLTMLVKYFCKFNKIKKINPGIPILPSNLQNVKKSIKTPKEFKESKEIDL